VVAVVKRRELAVAGGGRREEARVGRLLRGNVLFSFALHEDNQLAIGSILISWSVSRSRSARAKLEIGRSKPSFLKTNEQRWHHTKHTKKMEQEKVPSEEDAYNWQPPFYQIVGGTVEAEPRITAQQANEAHALALAILNNPELLARLRENLAAAQPAATHPQALVPVAAPTTAQVQFPTTHAPVLLVYH
jgi:hypothetical protein